MLLDSILKLHDKITNTRLGKNREQQITELEQATLGTRAPRTTG
jgi:NADH-quinone oxidoreductase subunit B